MAGGGGPHNKSPRRGSGLLGGGVGVVFADWNAPALGGILDQQGVGNVSNSNTYQLRNVIFFWRIADSRFTWIHDFKE